MTKQAKVNPDDFDTFPTEALVAILPEDSNLDSVRNALESSGVGSERVTFLVGADGLRSLDPGDQEDGFLSRFKRALESVGMEGREFEATKQALEAGKTVGSVTETADDEAEAVRQTLISAGAVQTFYFGKWTTTRTGTVGGENESN